jgi:hypothetical protein
VAQDHATKLSEQHPKHSHTSMHGNALVRRHSFFSLINFNYAIGAVQSDKIALP